MKVSSEGGNADSVSYEVAVDGAPVDRIILGDERSIALPAGVHTLQLTRPTNPHCSSPNSTPMGVSVRGGSTTTVALSVKCPPPPPPPPPTSGSLLIYSSTTGSFIDTNGYMVRVDSGALLPLAVNSSVNVPALSIGTHSVMLSDVATNCTVAGSNPQVVSVTQASGAWVTFNVTCVIPRGSVRVTTHTTGTKIDPDGYVLTIDSYPYSTAPIAVNGTATVDSVLAGSHVVGLSGMATNCGGVDPYPVPVTVEFGKTADVALNVICGEQGLLRVTTTTTGPDQPPNGYAVNLWESNGAGLADSAISANGTVTFNALPVARYLVGVSSVPASCSVIGPSQVSTSVAVGTTTDVGFSIQCVAARTFAYVDNGILIASTNAAGPYSVGFGSGDRDPDWSSPDARIVFTSTQAGSADIYVANPDGSGVTRLTTDPGADESPAWSPDGQRIAFVSDRSGAKRIYVMNADGSNVQPVSAGPGIDVDPAWSPDGSRIAFVSDRGGSRDIYLMSADGSNVVQLTHDALGESEPAWSPDGRKLAFAFVPDGGSIYTIGVDGTGEALLAGNWDGAASGPAWSSDGQLLAFAATCPFTYWDCESGVRAVDVASGDVRVLVDYSGLSPTWKR